MLGRLIAFCLDVKRKAQCNIDLTVAAHEWEKELTKKLKQVEWASRHRQTTQLSFNEQMKKCEALENSIRAGKASMLNCLLGENPAPRRQEAPSTLGVESVGSASSSANENQEMIDKDR